MDLLLEKLKKQSPGIVAKLKAKGKEAIDIVKKTAEAKAKEIKEADKKKEKE